MRHLFTASDLILSRAIRGMTGDPCSHYALEFTHLNMVMHSNLIGVHVDGLESFSKHCRVILSKEVPLTLEQELAVWNEMRPKVLGLGYDYKALLYQAYCVFKNKYVGSPMPTVNAWENRSALLCTELYDAAPEVITPTFPHLENLAMVRPYQLAQAIGAS
jgi:hypothetical protein